MPRATNTIYLLAMGILGVAVYWRHAVQTGPTAMAPASPAPAGLDEVTLMQRIRENVRRSPELAETLAREGRQRFPDSPDSEERDALLVDALVNQQRVAAARRETYYYYAHHPNGRSAERVFSMTGIHPAPGGPHRR